MKLHYYYNPYIIISPQTTHDLHFTKFTLLLQVGKC